jgi:peptide/nickel transport system ATP-binding protein
MAMACHPDLIIFDEPTTALDVTTQIEVLAAIRDAVATFGSAAIYISHDLAVVKYMADDILVMNQGEIVERGTSDEIYSNPRHPYTQQLLAAIPRGFRGTEASVLPLN